jgi:DNA-binding GntR family transcriptional regulator
MDRKGRSSLEIIPRSSLREEARHSIRAGVITGEIVAGQIYSAPSLAERLGVSATPVREALLDLANEGLVEAVRNRGFRVVALDENDLDEIFELRNLVEPASVGNAVGKHSPEQLKDLKRLATELNRAVEDGDIERFLTIDQEFHLGLIEPLRNRRLSELITRLRDQQRLHGLRALAESEALRTTSSEHDAILTAVAAGDRVAAEKLMRQHLRHTRGIWAGRAEVAPVSDA